MARFAIYNPTAGRRIIYDGLKNRRLEIQPGATLNDIALADHVVTRLRELAKANPRGELVLTEGAEAVVTEPVPAAAASAASTAAMEMKVDDDLVTVIKAKAAEPEPEFGEAGAEAALAHANPAA